MYIYIYTHLFSFFNYLYRKLGVKFPFCSESHYIEICVSRNGAEVYLYFMGVLCALCVYIYILVETHHQGKYSRTTHSGVIMENSEKMVR